MATSATALPSTLRAVASVHSQSATGSASRTQPALALHASFPAPTAFVGTGPVAPELIVLTETASVFVQPVTPQPHLADFQGPEYWSYQPPGGSDVSLHAPWWTVTTFGGSRSGITALRGQNYEVPFGQGQANRAKMPDSRVLTLVMQTNGAVDFNVPLQYASDQTLAFNDNWDAIKSLFWHPGIVGSQQGRLTRRWKLTQSGVSQVVTATALAEIAGTMDPSMNGRGSAVFSVDLLLADPFFYGAQQQQAIPANGTVNVINLGDDFVGFGSAVPYTIVLNGPLTVPKLTNSTWGVTFTVNQSLPAGFSLTVDVLNMLATGSDGFSYGGLFTHTGARPWMVLGPVGNSIATPAPQVNTLTLSTLNVRDTGNAVMTWSPPYL